MRNLEGVFCTGRYLVLLFLVPSRLRPRASGECTLRAEIDGGGSNSFGISPPSPRFDFLCQYPLPAKDTPDTFSSSNPAKYKGRLQDKIEPGAYVCPTSS